MALLRSLLFALQVLLRGQAARVECSQRHIGLTGIDTPECQHKSVSYPMLPYCFNRIIGARRVVTTLNTLFQQRTSQSLIYVYPTDVKPPCDLISRATKTIQRNQGQQEKQYRKVCFRTL